MSILFFTACNEPDSKAAEAESTPAGNEKESTQWLVSLYTKAIDSNLFNTESLRVIYYNRLNDSTSYCLFQLSDELCTSTFLATQVNKANKQIRQIEESCDGDYSNPVYTYSQYRFDSITHTFSTTEIVETAKPEFVTEENGEKRFRDGFTLENAKTTTDSMVVIRKVLPDGRISEVSK
jgi:hypothetical protein